MANTVCTRNEHNIDERTVMQSSKLELQLGVRSFNTVLHNAKLGYYTRLSCSTAVVDALRLINWLCAVHELLFHF